LLDQVARTVSGAVVFDLDGTLIDSAPDIHTIANLVLAGVGAAPITLADTRQFIGNGAGVFVSKMRAARGIPDGEQDCLLAEFVGRYDTAVGLTDPYPGVEAALAELRARGLRLGVCTNKPERPTRSVLDHLGLTRYFDAILGGDSLPVHKPDPAPLHATFAALGDETGIFVGDSEVDAETAERAGVPFMLFTLGYRKCAVAEMRHHAAFDDFATLPALIATVRHQRAAPAASG
jgi:phosphoglycolate phosphatase